MQITSDTAKVASLEKELQSTRDSLTFYRSRCELLQHWQSFMRDPERTLVCDVLANGTLLVGPDGNLSAVRYGGMPIAELEARFRGLGAP